MFLLDDIVLGPVKGTVWLAKKIRDHVNGVLYDVGAIKEDLKALEERLAAGQLSPKEFAAREDLLLIRLGEAKEFEELKNQGHER